MNICRFYGQLFLEYSVELVFFGLSSSPNLFIEPRKNLKGSELDDAKCLQKIRKILRDMLLWSMFAKKEICQFPFSIMH